MNNKDILRNAKGSTRIYKGKRRGVKKLHTLRDVLKHLIAEEIVEYKP